MRYLIVVIVLFYACTTNYFEPSIQYRGVKVTRDYMCEVDSYLLTFSDSIKRYPTNHNFLIYERLDKKHIVLKNVTVKELNKFIRQNR